MIPTIKFSTKLTLENFKGLIAPIDEGCGNMMSLISEGYNEELPKMIGHVLNAKRFKIVKWSYTYGGMKETGVSSLETPSNAGADPERVNHIFNTWYPKETVPLYKAKIKFTDDIFEHAGIAIDGIKEVLLVHPHLPTHEDQLPFFPKKDLIVRLSEYNRGCHFDIISMDSYYILNVPDSGLKITDDNIKYHSEFFLEVTLT